MDEKRTARPTVARGFRVGVIQDSVLRRVMQKTGLSFTGVIHAALAAYVREQGEHWPTDEMTPARKAS